MGKVLYRYDINYTSEDGPTSIELREYPVVRETEKCYFIRRVAWSHHERRVLRDAHNTYAFSTKEAAKNHFIRRTHTRIRWFEFWTRECETALKLIEEVDNETE